MKRVLSIDGGGIRGLLPARFVQALEEVAGHPASDIFDLVAGTSTGGIIALGLASGIEAKALAEFYAARGPEIFPPGDAELKRVRAVYEPMWSALPLEAALADVLGDARLSYLDGHPEVIVPAYAVSIPDNWFFRTWKARFDPAADFYLREVARATSAAPLYFAPASIEHGLTLVDGGVFANNPTAVAVSAAHELWPGERLLVVSLGTGSLSAPIALGNGGGVEVLPRIVDVLMDASASLAGHLISGDASVDLRRFSIDLSTPVGADQRASPAMDDASAGNLALLELLARKMIASADLPALARELSTIPD